MSSSVPDGEHRWRCSACGNLTRFDVVRTRRTAEYWHVGLDGEPVVEESELLAEDVGRVGCRWCGRSDAIEVVRRVAAVQPPADPGAER